MKKVLVLFLILLGLWIGGVIGVQIYILKSMEKSLGIEIVAKERFGLFYPKTVLRELSFDWENKLYLKKGDLIIEPKILSVFTEEGMRIKMSSFDAELTFQSSWEKTLGHRDVKLKQFIFDGYFSEDGIRKIIEVRAYGDIFNFELVPK